MRAYREDPDALGARPTCYTAKNSAEEVLHPEEDTEVFADPDELEAAYRDGDDQVVPQRPARARPAPRPRGWASWRRGSSEPRALPRPAARGLRAGGLHGPAHAPAGGGASPLTVTSTVRDDEYQEVLRGRNPEATNDYSLHTTGCAFDVSRAYASRAQARAFQFALDRLQSLNLIAWVREPAAIHVTARADAARLTTLLREP